MIIYGISLFNVLRAFLHYHSNLSRWPFSGRNFSFVDGMMTGLASFNSSMVSITQFPYFCGKCTFSQSLSQMMMSRSVATIITNCV